MSRVLGVVGNTIMVHIHDVVPGDVLSIYGDERDPIVERIERDGNKVRLHYKSHAGTLTKHSIWMNPEQGERMFVTDLKNERREFEDQSV